MYLKQCLTLLTACSLLACNMATHEERKTAFSKRGAKETGIDFNNVILESDAVNLVSNEYAYMGGGVGIIDINNDGLTDVFFSGNQVSSKLYLNTGNNRFLDITESAGVSTNKWCTGVSIVDINNDGYQDMYISVSGSVPSSDRKNLLFVNNKNKTFSERATEYGLADTGYSTQAAFFDADKDGDLDMYLVNHLLQGPNPNNIVKKDTSGHSPLNDRLYQNTGIQPATGHCGYKDVSMSSGIKDNGYGLGISISDFDNDGWPDMYVTNDYLSNDILWLNNRNGSFRNIIASSLNHQSYSSMGVDAADINNDGLMDIATLDMQPAFNRRKKEMYSFLGFERYEMEMRAGYEPQLMRNMLQLNNGNLRINDTILPRFSEIGQLAGISETDWSWSVLMADFDNDGWKDIHITNGIGRDLINGDFVLFRSQRPENAFAGKAGRQKQLREQLNALGEVKLANYFFRNNRDYTFTHEADQSGIDDMSLSNGAAYADLDNDGDLDLVVNNINQEAFVYINNSRQQQVADSTRHFLTIMLQGDLLNQHAIGARVYISTTNSKQVVEQYPVRGYASSVDNRIFVGLGKDSVVDLTIVWPDGRQSNYDGVKADQQITLNWKDATAYRANTTAAEPSLFKEVTGTNGLVFRHSENFFNDFGMQRLLPQKYSQLGPFIASADINGDGLQDFFIGGAFKQSGRIFTQLPGGKFSSKDLVPGDKFQEDMSSVFLDANGDHYPDLFIAGGSVEYRDGSTNYQPRLYLNNGKGDFTLDAAAIPATVNTSAQASAVFDLEGDGDPDLVVAGRVTNHYPGAPRSFILQNDQGIFKDVTEAVCPQLTNAGMITAVSAVDFNRDQKTDLIIAGEWMPLTFLQNNGGQLQDVTATTGLQNNNGMWRSLEAADLDQDGDLDLVAGNLGLNSRYRTQPGMPMWQYARDLDDNGSIDPVIGYYIKDESRRYQLFPAVSFNQLAEQVPGIRKRYLYFKDYAMATLDDIFEQDGAPENTMKMRCDELRSCWFENRGNGKFVQHELPVEAQFAPVNAIVCADIDHDGKVDILLAGNEYQAEVLTGRYDASFGCFLRGDGKKHFTAISPSVSGLVLNGDTKHLKILAVDGNRKMLLAVINDAPMKAWLLP